MQSRFAQLVLAEAYAFATLVLGGLALLGGSMTWSGASRHTAVVSWVLVGALAAGAIVAGRVTATRLRRVFARSTGQVSGTTEVLGEAAVDQ